MTDLKNRVDRAIARVTAAKAADAVLAEIETTHVIVGRCADCRWWTPTDGQTEWGQCQLTESRGEASHRASLAVAEDVDGYRSWLSTRRDFGCVQWELRKAEDDGDAETGR